MRGSRRVLSLVLSGRVAIVAAVCAGMITAGVPTAFAQRGNGPKTITVLPMTVTSVVPQNGQLVVKGTIGSQPFSTPLTLTPGAIPTGGSCPILNLSLAPINLTVLGLSVNTSAICLDVSAQPGQGQLLGNLLCGIATALSQGTGIGAILAGLTTSQLTALSNGLTSLLNQAVFVPLTSSQAVAGATCSVLHLSLGPLNLNVLGLVVNLDNCANGPVTVDITATQGGGLLGNLLCNLSNLLNSNGSAAALTGLLQQIAAAIGQLLG